MQLLNRTGASFTRVEYQCSAGGSIASSTSIVPVNCQYTQPGVYEAKVSVFDQAAGQPEAMIYSTTQTIVVTDANATDAFFRAIWSGMNNALLTGDQTRALGYLNESARTKYSPVFTVLASRMTQIVGSYSTLQRSQLGNGVCEYAVNRTIDGINRIFFISFVRDEDGIWRLDSM